MVLIFKDYMKSHFLEIRFLIFLLFQMHDFCLEIYLANHCPYFRVYAYILAQLRAYLHTDLGQNLLRPLVRECMHFWPSSIRVLTFTQPPSPPIQCWYHRQPLAPSICYIHTTLNWVEWFSFFVQDCSSVTTFVLHTCAYRDIPSLLSISVFHPPPSLPS